MVNALIILTLGDTLIVNEIRWNADSVRTTNTFSTAVEMVLAIALIIDIALFTDTDSNFAGNLSIEVTVVTTTVKACK